MVPRVGYGVPPVALSRSKLLRRSKAFRERQQCHQPTSPVAGKSKQVRVPRNIEMLDLFALHKLWCKVHFAARQAHESVARA